MIKNKKRNAEKASKYHGTEIKIPNQDKYTHDNLTS